MNLERVTPWNGSIIIHTMDRWAIQLRKLKVTNSNKKTTTSIKANDDLTEKQYLIIRLDWVVHLEVVVYGSSI